MKLRSSFISNKEFDDEEGDLPFTNKEDENFEEFLLFLQPIVGLTHELTIHGNGIKGTAMYNPDTELVNMLYSLVVEQTVV